MKTNHVIDELSAFIDGESNHSDRVEKHLAECAECTRRHKELSKLSTHLRNMAPPHLSVGFSGRVMGAVRASHRPKPTFVKVGWALGMAASLVLALGAALLYLSSGGPEEVSNNADADAILAELESRMDDEEALNALATWVEEDPLEDMNGDALTVMADAGWLDLSENMGFGEDDFDWSLSSLDEEETAVFRALLIAEYLPEENIL